MRESDNVGGTSQNFAYDTQTRPGQPLIMMDGTNAYIYGPANFGAGTAPLEQIPLNLSILPVYLFSDPNGVRSIMTAVGTSVGVATQTYSYSTYGTRTATGLGLLGSTPFGFQGGYTDASGLIYFVNRYYDPATEEWLTVDPDVAETGQPYIFTGGDPVNAVDPLGLCFVVCSVVHFVSHTVHKVVKVVKSAAKKVKRAADVVGHAIKTHPKIAIGIALGVTSIVTGGASLALAPGLLAGSAAVASVATGAVAADLDQGDCSSGNTAACVGRDLGVAGAFSSALGGYAAFAGGETLLGAASGGAGAFGFNVGAAGTIFDGVRGFTGQ